MKKLNSHIALIVVDIQNGFCPGGSLAVEQGDEIIPLVNQLATHFEHVILTQDWHPADHISFASNHEGRQPFEMIELDYGPQTLWPSHCVQGSVDAHLNPLLDIPHARLILRKGMNPKIDSYSAFMEADRKTSTGLSSYLQTIGINEVFIVGLATDFCVSWSAQDAVKFGFKTSVIEDACKAIDLNGSLNQAWADMQSLGVQKVHSSLLLQ